MNPIRAIAKLLRPDLFQSAMTDEHCRSWAKAVCTPPPESYWQMEDMSEIVKRAYEEKYGVSTGTHNDDYRPQS